MNFFIRDARNAVAGNPKGYPTHKGAERQANMVGSKAFNQIWNVFNEVNDALDKQGEPQSGRLIYSIKLGSV
jgi:hypothetical protein